MLAIGRELTHKPYFGPLDLHNLVIIGSSFLRISTGVNGLVMKPLAPALSIASVTKSRVLFEVTITIRIVVDLICRGFFDIDPVHLWHIPIDEKHIKLLGQT